ncbi:FtsX-like permease family protein [Candidatus Lokiarchaeum ossiferum]|uniref:FtsX-like permease family protein n=1 Tax=Candidatus Lokiarchaeum ossiferum TaxID=2951803 RepID=UPI00352C6617
MRIQGIWKIIKNKHEFWVVVILISCSLSLLSAMSYVTDLTEKTIVTDVIDDYGADIHVSLNTGMDPSEAYSQYMRNYQSPIKFEAQFRSTVITLAEVITSLNYQGEDMNITKEWTYPTTSIDFYVVGIDESSFNFLQNQSSDKVLGLDFEYSDFKQGFVISNLFASEEAFLKDLQVSIYTNAETFLEQSKPVMVEFFNPKINRTAITANTWITAQNSILPLISRFDIIDVPFFYSLLGITSENLQVPILLCGEELFQHFEPLEGEEIFQYMKTDYLNLRIDREYLLTTSPQQFYKQILAFRSYVRGNIGGTSLLNIQMDSLVSHIEDISENSLKSQIYTLLIYIPIFLLCGMYMTMIFYHMIEKRKKEYGLYLINGMEIHTLKRTVLLAGFLQGVLGGAISSIGGILIAKILGNSFYPNLSSNYFRLVIGTIPVLLQNFFTYSLLGGLLALISLWKPLKLVNFTDLKSKVSPSSISVPKTPSRKKKFQIVLFFGILAMGILAFYLEIQSIPIVRGRIDNPAIAEILYYFGPLMGITPFVLPLLLINFWASFFGRWLTSKKKNAKALKISELPEIFSENERDFQKNTAFLQKITVWNLKQNFVKNRKLAKIFSITFVLITISANLVSTYRFSEEIHFTLHNAGGEMMKVDVIDDHELLNLTQSSQQIPIKNIASEESHLNGFYHSQINGARYSAKNTDWDVEITSIERLSLWYYQFSWTNYSLLIQDTPILDEWFFGGTAAEIMNKLELPNSILIPEFLLNRGIKINDTLSFTIKMENGTRIQQEGVIIGAYSKFPTSNIQFSGDDGVTKENLFAQIYMSYNLIQKACIKIIQLVSYTEQPMTDHQKFDLINGLYENLDAEISIEVYDMVRYIDPFDSYVFHLFQIEGILLIGFTMIGFLFFNIVDNIQSGTNLALLRSKGVTEKILLKSHFLEILGLMGVSTLTAILAIMSTPSLITYLNFIRTVKRGSTFYLYFTTNWEAVLGIILGGHVFFLLINMIFIFLQVKSTRSDQKLELFLRSTRQ